MERTDNMITRWRLLDALDHAAPGALVLVVAPAGYGKSTLLRQWAAHSSRAIVLLEATAEQDANLLGAAIADGLARVLPAAEDLQRRAHRSEFDWACDLVPQLLALVAQHPVALVIDDTHAVTSTSATEMLSVLARSWPAPSVLVLSGRVRPPVPLVRDRVDAPLVVVGEADLDFDEQEIEALLAERRTGFDAAGLLELTGGWPAGLRLAALVRGEDLGDKVMPVDRYLAAHVLGSFTPHEIDYLGHIAVLAPAPARIIDRVLHRNDTVEVLRWLRQRGLPMVTVPHDPDEPVVVHALLAEVLIGRLARRQPDAVDDLIDLAVVECEKAGELSYVVALLDRHGRAEAARSMIYRYMFPMVATGRTAELRSWLERFDRAELERDPMLVLAYANILRPRDEQVVRALFAPHLDDTTTVLPDGTTPSVACRRMLIAFGLDPADPDDTGALGGWRQTSAGRRSWDLYSNDRLEEAEAVLLGVRDSAHKYPLTNAAHLAKLAIISLETGRPGDAAALSEQASSIVTEEHMEETALGFIADTVALKLARRAGALDDAEQIAVGIRRKMAVVGDGTMLERVTTLIELGNLYVDLGYPAQVARSLHAEGVAIAARWPSTVRLDRQLAQLDARIAGMGPARRARAEPEMISAAELRVLRYLPSHLTLARIAEELYVSHSTVKSQCQSIYRKLEVKTRADAVTTARRLGLLS